MIALSLKVNISQNFQGKHIIWVKGAKKLKTAHPVNYFPGFLGKNIKNYPPSKLFLFTLLDKEHERRHTQEWNQAYKQRRWEFFLQIT